MRILVTTPEHAHLHRGGLALSVARITDGLARLGHDVTVVVFDGAGPYREDAQVPAERTTLDRAGVTLELIPHADILTAALPEELRTTARRLESAYLRLTQLADEHRPEIIVSLFPSAAGYPSALVASQRDVPLVLGFRGNDAGRNLHDARWLPLLQHCLRVARAATFVARDLESLARAAAPVMPPTAIIHNGVEPEILQRRWRPPAARAPLFGAVGFFQPKKGIELLLRAVADAPALRDRVRLFGAFVRSCTDPGAHGVAIRGPLPRAEALNALETLDVFVAPSLADGCPNAVLEAAAAGRAILCTRVGAMADLFTHGESAYVLPAWTPAALRSGLETLDADAGLRQRLAAGARRVAESLTLERERTAWDRLLRQAAAPR
ncbi:glycosyltransferase family 4 protein [bacterium]|nr:glycosyltransferase family 4 protein [bacterium]